MTPPEAFVGGVGVQGGVCVQVMVTVVANPKKNTHRPMPFKWGEQGMRNMRHGHMLASCHGEGKCHLWPCTGCSSLGSQQLAHSDVEELAEMRCRHAALPWPCYLPTPIA